MCRIPEEMLLDYSKLLKVKKVHENADMGHLRKFVSLLRKQLRYDHSSIHTGYKVNLDDNMINFCKCV